MIGAFTSRETDGFPLGARLGTGGGHDRPSRQPDHAGRRRPGPLHRLLPSARLAVVLGVPRRHRQLLPHRRGGAGAVGPRRRALPGVALAINLDTPEDVDAALQQAVAAGARLVRPAHTADWGGYSGYFADPGAPLGSRLQPLLADRPRRATHPPLIRDLGQRQPKSPADGQGQQ
ncbi:MAG: VOC family protein [Mycobacterium leprae]